MVEIVGTLLQTVPPIAAAVGLIFAGVQLSRNNREHKESNRIRELQLLENTYREIVALEKYKFEHDVKGQGGDDNDEFYKEWFELFFSQVEWLSFLINHHFIKHNELVTYFRNAYMTWYEVYTKYAPDEIRGNNKAHSSFKFLYKRFKEELEKEK